MILFLAVFFFLGSGLGCVSRLGLDRPTRLNFCIQRTIEFARATLLERFRLLTSHCFYSSCDLYRV